MTDMWNDPRLTALAREITEEMRTNHFAVGDVVTHPDGRTVKIVGGSYYGTYGGVSNFWDWREVLPDGSLAEKKECGYGWSS